MARARARHMRPLDVGASRVGFAFCREAEVRGSFLVFAPRRRHDARLV